MQLLLQPQVRQANLAGSLLAAVTRTLYCAQRLSGRFTVVGCLVVVLAISPRAFAQSRTVLVVGDSISAAYGMNLEQGWVAELDRRLSDKGDDYTFINASISGDTTGGGLHRLPALLTTHKPAIVIIELGGNDGLRGYPVAQLRHNLTRMVELAKAQGARVLLLAMEVPPNLGSRYTQLFRESFAMVANNAGAHVAPFILEGIATNRALMQADGIHPTAEAQGMIVDNIWPYLKPLMEG